MGLDGQNEDLNFEVYDNNNIDAYILKDNPKKLILEEKEIDYIIQYKKSELESLKQIRKLEKIREAIADKNPKVLEDEYFGKFDCFSEKSKIMLEAEYIKTKMIEEKDKYITYPNYDLNLRLVTHILNSINYISSNDYANIKQCLIFIELDLKLNIAFFSEVENVYNLKVKQKEDNSNTYTRGL